MASKAANNGKTPPSAATNLVGTHPVSREL